MLRPRWRKVVRDLWLNKTRTLLVVLSVAAGVFAVGVVAHLHAIVTQDLRQSYAAVVPANATIFTADTFDEELVRAIRRMPEVGEADGRRSIMAQFRVREGGEWRPIELFVIPDYDDIRVNKIAPERVFGPDPVAWPRPDVWPPPERAVLLERTSLLMADLGLTLVRQGDAMRLKMPNETERDLAMAGLTYDFTRTPATNTGRAYGYITFDTLEWLGEPRVLNELHITVAERADDEAHIQEVAQRVRDKVEKGGLTVLRTDVHEPGRLPLEHQFRAITAVLVILGVLALLLSGFLIVNTISALLAQHVRQIAVMKTIGARTRQIAGMYIATVLTFGALALLIAVPLGAVSAQFCIDLLSYFINFTVHETRFPLHVVALEIAVGLGTPLVAAAFPIIASTRVTVREALHATGAEAAPQEGGALNTLLARLRRLPRPTVLAVRNTFRRRSRLALTVTTLTLGSAIFMSVVSVRSALFLALDDYMKYWQFDVQLNFDRAYRVSAVEQLAALTPGVAAVESWGGVSTFRIRPDTSESSVIDLTGLPAETRMLQPTMLGGRWLRPDDQDALVINSAMADNEPDLGLGSTVRLKIGGRERDWQIVGIVQTVGDDNAAYANYPSLARLTGSANRAASLQVLGTDSAPEAQRALAQELTRRFEAAGIGLTNVQTGGSMRQGTALFFDIIVSFLMMMAVILTLVGGMGLMGTMSINVMERTREIGVSRAIGASNGAIMHIFLVEGLLIGAMSWLIGAVLALPMGLAMAHMVGMQFLGMPLAGTYELGGVGLWLVLVLVVAALATWLPARRAVEVSVREALAYE